VADLTDLSSVSGDDLTESQIRGIIAQIDLNILNLLRDGKLGTARIAENTPGGKDVDRSAAIRELRETRQFYVDVLQNLNPTIVLSQYDDPDDL